MNDQQRIETAADNCEVLRARLAKYEDAEGRPVVVNPDPYGWVAAGGFYTDRQAAIEAAGKTPCIEVYSRPQMDASENRSLQRQAVAEELARQLKASGGEIRELRRLNSSPVSTGATVKQSLTAGGVGERAADALEFADIEGFPEYKVSSDGIIYRKENGNLISQQSNDKGYLTVNLSNACGPVRMTTHRVVLESFVGKRPEGMQARHVDGNPANNRLSNLCWGTAAENEADKAMHGTKAVGSKNGASKLTEEMVREIIAARDSGGRFWGAKAFAEKFGVNLSTIIRVASGRHWAETSAALSAPSHGEQVRHMVMEGVTVERDVFGTIHIKSGDFDFIQIRYQYPYTDNSGTWKLAERIVAMLAAAPSAGSQERSE